MSETKSPTPIVERKDCRACGGVLEDLFSLGTQEVINLGDRIPLKAPLDVTKCQSCHLVQLRHTVDKELLFRHYYFRSSANMKEHLKGVVKDAVERVGLKDGDIVVDIGSNDGALLEGFHGLLQSHAIKPRVQFEGFEPSDAALASFIPPFGGITNDFFSADSYFGHSFTSFDDIRQAKIITALFVFYDLDDPNAFLQDIKKVLAPDGLFVIEMNYLPAMLASNGVDNIVHEHLAYYSLRSLQSLLMRNELYVDEVSFNDANGGSVRIYIKHVGTAGNPYDLSPSLVGAVRKELGLRLDTKQPYLDFAKRIKAVAESLKVFDSPNIDILGASTRGATLLQYAGIKGRQTVEKNTDKIGKTYLGMKIVSDEEFKKNPPDYAYVTAHYFKSQIIERYWDYLLGGGKLVVPLPLPVVISVEKL